MRYLLSLLFCLSLMACGENDLQNAKNSLKGNWTVNRIYVENTGGNGQNQTGNLGAFGFSETNLNYSFNKGGIVKNGQGAWTLKRELVNSGFVKVEKYTLEFDGLSFVCAFGDQTSDAEKNATNIRLEGVGNDGNPFQMWLSK